MSKKACTRIENPPRASVAVCSSPVQWCVVNVLFCFSTMWMYPASRNTSPSQSQPCFEHDFLKATQLISSLQTLLPPQSHPQTETLSPLSRRLLFLRLIRDRRRYAILHQLLVPHWCFSRARRHRHSFCAADRHFDYPFPREFRV